MSKSIYLLLAILIIIFSNNALTTWEKLKGPYGYQIDVIATGNSIALTGSIHGFHKSTNNGLSWEEANNGNFGCSITAIKHFGNYILAGAWDGMSGLLFYSDDNANTWSQINTLVLPYDGISCFAANDSFIFAGTPGGKVFRSSNGGINWEQTPYNYQGVYSMINISDTIFVGTMGGSVKMSTNNGISWISLGNPDFNIYVSSIDIFNGNLIVAYGTSVYLYNISTSSWIKTFLGLPQSNQGVLKVNGSEIFLGTDYGLIYSTDAGLSWTNIGLKSITKCLEISNNVLIVGTRDAGIFISSDKGTSWLQTGIMSNVLTEVIHIKNNNMFVGNNAQPGLFISRDLGGAFTHYDNLSYSYVYDFYSNDTAIYAATEPNIPNAGGVFKSTDNGKNWINIGLTNKIVRSLTANNNYLFAGTTIGVFRTSNDGAIWQQVNSGLNVPVVWKIISTNSGIFVATNSGVYKSTNNGTNWTSFGLIDTPLTSITSNGNYIFAGTPYGVFRSTISSPEWIDCGFASTLIIRLIESNSKIFALTSNDIFFTNDDGNTWQKANEDGISQTPYNAIAVNDSLIFIGTWGDGIYKNKLENIFTSVFDNKDYLIKDYKLYQNFPNPFNPVTIIQYDIPKESFVSLKVYDILGQEVATLVNGIQKAGSHSVNFNASNLNSGIYFYRLVTGEFCATKKIILMK